MSPLSSPKELLIIAEKSGKIHIINCRRLEMNQELNRVGSDVYEIERECTVKSNG